MPTLTSGDVVLIILIVAITTFKIVKLVILRGNEPAESPEE